MSAQKASETEKKSLHTVSMSDLGIEHEEGLSSAAYSQWVRSLLNWWRQGTVACKGRSDVSYANRKPWKQKGTGRARAGSARSPLWRGGGVIFGPQPRTRTHKFPKKMKLGILNTLACQFINDNKVLRLDWSLPSDKPSTRQARAALTQSGLALGGQRIVLFVRQDDYVTGLSFANIPEVEVVSYDQANAYTVTRGNCWVVFKQDMDHFKRMIAR